MTAREGAFRLKTAIVSLVVVLSNVLGNFSLSWGLKRGTPVLSDIAGYLGALVSPWVVLGVCLLILWTLSRMALLSWADLSFVLPVTALGYPLSALMGRLFLAEHVSIERWAGTALIVAGTLLVGSTPPRTTS
jgi:uncharacterized membrane protein